MVIGAFAETVPLGRTKSGGAMATSICVIRREPGFWPTGGVNASDVSTQIGFICPPVPGEGVAVQVCPAAIGYCVRPSQHTCCALWAGVAAAGLLPSTI